MHYSFRYRRRQTPQEAEEAGSFYHRFEVSELCDLLAERLTIRSLHGYWIYLPKTYWLFIWLGRWRPYWDRIWRNLSPLSKEWKVPFGGMFAQILIVKSCDARLVSLPTIR